MSSYEAFVVGDVVQLQGGDEQRVVGEEPVLRGLSSAQDRVGGNVRRAVVVGVLRQVGGFIRHRNKVQLLELEVGF